MLAFCEATPTMFRQYMRAMLWDLLILRQPTSGYRPLGAFALTFFQLSWISSRPVRWRVADIMALRSTRPPTRALAMRGRRRRHCRPTSPRRRPGRTARGALRSFSYLGVGGRAFLVHVSSFAIGQAVNSVAELG